MQMDMSAKWTLPQLFFTPAAVDATKSPQREAAELFSILKIVLNEPVSLPCEIH